MIQSVRTIAVPCGEINNVFNWCFRNLSKRAYLLSYEFYQGRTSPRQPMIWRKMTMRLFNSPCGTYRTASRDYAVTVLFVSAEDAILFALRWGSIPITENSAVLEHAPHYADGKYQ